MFKINLLIFINKRNAVSRKKGTMLKAKSKIHFLMKKLSYLFFDVSMLQNKLHIQVYFSDVNLLEKYGGAHSTFCGRKPIYFYANTNGKWLEN